MEETNKKGNFWIWFWIVIWIVLGLAFCSKMEQGTGLKPKPPSEYEPDNSGNFFQ
jgi:hypothetical protein